MGQLFLRPILFCLSLWLLVATALSSPIDPDTLKHEILARVSRVDSFEFIATEAQRLGVKAYLFGGSAAAYAHYVHWDLMREVGDARFHADRFTYAYVDIFRSNQDMDIVVDGPLAQIQELEKLLAEKFPFFQGNKSVWELRPLRTDRGDKQALLNNPDFLNQHTDSNSTALIELNLDSQQAQILDLRDWNNPKHCQFLIDVQAQKLHYYYSELHPSTSRAKEGLNPPILSVIRYLTKAFQYELAIDAETKILLKRLVNEFDYNSIDNSYVKKWINNNGKKLYQNAVNLEYAAEILDELGLKQKLKVVGNVNNVEELAWWMNKEPLRSKPMGQGSGKTARELGLDIVAHETNSFSAWESIVKSHENVPNVFISRSGGNGENAMYGDGLYTRVGREGARGTGITIRFKLHPLAREGSDFEFNENQSFVLIKNKQALEVIHEDLAWTPMEYFEKLLAGFTFDHSDKAVTYKLKQKMLKQAAELRVSEMQEIYLKMQAYFNKPAAENVKLIYQEWMSFKFPENYIPTYLQYFKAVKLGLNLYNSDRELDTNLKKILRKNLSKLSLSEQIELDQQILIELTGDNKFKSIVDWIDFKLSSSSWGLEWLWVLEYEVLKSQGANISPAIMHLIERGQFKTIASLINTVLSDTSYKLNPNLLSMLIERGNEDVLHAIADKVFKRPDVFHLREQMMRLIERGDHNVLGSLAYSFFSKPESYVFKSELKRLIERSTQSGMLNVAQQVFSKPHTQHMEDLVELLIKRGDNRVLSMLAEHTFSQPHTAHMQDLISLLIKKGGHFTWQQLAIHTFSKPHTRSMQNQLRLLIEVGDDEALKSLARFTFSRPEAEFMGPLIRQAIEKIESHLMIEYFIRHVFSEPHTRNMEKSMLLLMRMARYDQWHLFRHMVLGKEHTKDMQHLQKIRQMFNQSGLIAWNKEIREYLHTIDLVEKPNRVCLRRNFLTPVDIAL